MRGRAGQSCTVGAFVPERRGGAVVARANIKEPRMNWDRVEGNWKQLKGSVKEQWGKLTDYQLDVVAGKRDQLAGKIQETYGISKDEAEKQLTAWHKRINE